MGIYGNLQTMPVDELLGWIEAGKKSGTLEVERDKIIKRLTFREGRVVGCSSNDPATLLGQFLLSLGTISGETLAEALRLQEQTGRNLAEVLRSMEAIAEAEILAFVDLKIDEAVFGLFDSDEGGFRFEADTPTDPYAVEVDLEVADVLRQGRRRAQERRWSSAAIGDRRTVLRRSGRPSPPELSRDGAAGRILELIDGNRTVAEILLHSHAPEFQVDRLLTSLLASGVVEIKEARPALEEPRRPVEGPAAPGAAEPVEDTGPDGRPTPGEAGKKTIKRRYRILRSRPTLDPTTFRAGMNLALQLMSSGRHGAALDLLEDLSKALPGDESLAQLVAAAEHDYLETIVGAELRPSNVPVLARPHGPGSTRKVSPKESFLLGLIDGKKDFKTIIWLAPMRELEVLKTLAGMLQNGLIEVQRAA